MASSRSRNMVAAYVGEMIKKGKAFGSLAPSLLWQPMKKQVWRTPRPPSQEAKIHKRAVGSLCTHSHGSSRSCWVIQPHQLGISWPRTLASRDNLNVSHCVQILGESEKQSTIWQCPGLHTYIQTPACLSPPNFLVCKLASPLWQNFVFWHF